MYCMQEGKELDIEMLREIIQQFQSKELSQMKNRERYYLGKHKILLKKPTDDGKPCNKAVANITKQIVDSYSGFLKSTNYDTDYEEILDAIKYNDVEETDNQLYKDLLVYGTCSEIHFVDKDGEERFVRLDPKTVIPVYDDSLEQNLIYAIRFWKVGITQFEQQDYWVEVYSDRDVKLYKSENGFSSYSLVENREHFYGMVPVSFCYLNNEQMGIIDQIMSLQDAYNSIFSDAWDSWDAFADAYLVITGQVADPEDFKEMKTHRILLLDEGCTADYLTKDINQSGFVEMLAECERKMRQITNCPDFSDEAFGTASGIALKLKLLGMRNNFTEHCNKFRKFLQRRVELLASIMAKIDGDNIWRDCIITFNENLPDDVESISRELNSLQTLVSKKTLLAQVPFVKDADEEFKKYQEEQKLNMDLYSDAFGDEDDDTANFESKK